MASVLVRRDGSVQVAIGSQDVGTGSRTVAAIVTSMSLGWLPIERIEVVLGSSDLPPSGASGGSATTSMMQNEISQSAQWVTGILFAAAAGRLEAPAETLEFREGGRVGVQGGDAEIPWEEACELLSEDAYGCHSVPLEEGSLWYLVDDEGRTRPGGKDHYTA